VNTRHIRKLATVAATAALTLQLFAGTSSAAVPNAVWGTVAEPIQYSEGNVAFFATYSLTDSGTLARLYADLDLTGAATATVSATKNGSPVAKACTPATGTSFDCSFKTVRQGDVIEVKVLATPAAYTAGAHVALTSSFSTTGNTDSDGGTSHGDTWDSSASSAYNADPNFAGGYGASNLSTRGTLSATGNPQIAALSRIPSNVGATVFDAAACTTPSAFPCIDINVDDGTTFGDPFILQVQYYANGAPTSFVHTYEDSAGDEQTQTITECARRNPSYPCFTFSNRNSTATIYLLHNGQVRRTS
jgi:hypothetical protein